MLRFLAFFVVIVSVIMHDNVALGNACGCQNNEFCMGQGCYTCNVYGDTYHHAYSVYTEYNDGEAARRESCDLNSSGALVCKSPYTPTMVQIANATYGYSCRCANDSYEYYANNAGIGRPTFECRRCDDADDPDNKRICPNVSASTVWFGGIVNGFSCKDGYEVTDTYTDEDQAQGRPVNSNDRYGCACNGTNKYIYEDANGNTTCRTCPITPDNEGVAQCGGGTFTCEWGYIRSRDGANGYKCASCWYEDYAYMFSPYEAEDEQYVELYDYDPLCQGNGCAQDVAIVSNLMENCTARVVYNGVGNDYWGLIINNEKFATSCNLVQVYRKPNTTFDGDYATNSAAAYWELVSSEFTGVAPGSYIDGSLCKPCTGDTYSYGGTFVDACFTKPSNASLTTESVTGAVFHIGGGYGTGSAEIHTGFTCNGTRIFKNGNAMCQSCPAASGVNNTTLNVLFDSSKTGIAACYINAGQTFQDEYGTLKIGENKCYANPETSTETIKFCVTSDACAQKLFEAVPTGTVNSVNDLKKKCSSGWFDLPASLNEYISDLTGVGCIQYYTDYGI